MPGHFGRTDGSELKATNVRVQALALDQIKLDRRNSRTHSGKQIGQIANSIAAFGFTHPLLVNEDGTLIAGEGRYKAAQRLGLAKVPAIVLAGLSPARQRALAIADNKIAENAGWGLKTADFSVIAVLRGRYCAQFPKSCVDTSTIGNVMRIPCSAAMLRVTSLVPGRNADTREEAAFAAKCSAVLNAAPRIFGSATPSGPI